MSLSNLVKRQVRLGAPSFIAALDAHLTKDPWEYRPGYHPSSIAYILCPRQHALIQLGLLSPHQDISAQTQRIFDDGHSRHERFQRWTREMGLVVKHEKFGRKKLGQEVKLKHPVGISGRCDDILALEEGWWDVVDYKGIKASAFSTLIQPLEHHRKQVIIYLGLVEHLFDGEPPAKLRGRIVYECKDTQNLKEFTVEWDDECREGWRELLDILAAINQAVKNEDPLALPCRCRDNGCERYDIEALRKEPQRVRV